MHTIANLPYLGLIKVEGPDAQKLLQGQLTCDVTDVTPTDTRLGAHCNPQGRVLSLFRLFIFQDAYYLQMRREMIDLALQALKKYAVFFKVTLSDASDALKTMSDTGFLSPASENWDTINMQLGYAMIYPETSGKFLPHELNLHQLNAISFTKGCYTGQEIIARMQYRGKLKNHLCLATYEQGNLVRGNDMFDEKGIAGKIVDYVNNTLLIVTQDTNHPLFIDSACTQPIQVNHVY